MEQGQTYTNGFPVVVLSSHLNLLEDFDPTRPIILDPFRWIPQGVYYEMFDDRNDLTVPFPRVLINDEVLNYTNQQFFNALDNDIVSIPQFRVRFLNQNGFNQAVVDLFTEYHY